MTVQESSASDVTPEELAPLDRRRRLLARLLDNLPYLVLGGMPPFLSGPIPFLSSEVLVLAYFSYHVLTYRAWGGHLGHLIFGARLRDASTGGRITLRQAALRSLYDIVPWGLFALLSISWIILSMGAGDRLDPLISGILDPLLAVESIWGELDSFELVMLTVTLIFWMIHWLALCSVVTPMGIMVIVREDRRHAFDILARVIVVKDAATA